jgi:hypothetical protein
LPELCRQSIDYAQAWVERDLAGHLLPDGALSGPAARVDHNEH